MSKLIVRAVKNVGLWPKFVKAFFMHLVNGASYRSNEEIEDLYKTCSGCELFSLYKEGTEEDEEGFCTKCKCHLTADPFESGNKLSYKSEECPVGKWTRSYDTIFAKFLQKFTNKNIDIPSDKEI